MRATVALTILYFVVLPQGASAQPWREAYDRGDVTTAAALLHAIVLERSHDEMFPPVDAAIQLATMYANGLGVRPDRIRACALFFLADRAKATKPHLQPETTLAARLYRQHCEFLSEDERVEALTLASGFRYGLEAQTFTLGPGHRVEIDRRAFTVHYAGVSRSDDVWAPLGWAQQVALVRHTRVDPPPDAGELKARHFLEFYYWLSSRIQGRIRRTLEWELEEIVGAELTGRSSEVLVQDDKSAWPPADVPSDVRNVSFRMLKTGEVRWQFDGAARSGVLDRIPTEHYLAPPRETEPPSAGAGRIDVSISDHPGRPLPGASVRIVNLPWREAKTGSDGRSTFENVPDGRYEVVATAKDFADSAPQVIDVSGSHAFQLDIALKRSTPLPTPVGLPRPPCCEASCHLPAQETPETLEVLAAASDAVIRASVQGQSSHEDGATSAGAAIWTTATLNVIESFKTSTQGSADDTITYYGGRVELGEYVSIARGSVALTVGDDYVLFLTRDESRGVRLHSEGVFRLRNGRVEPLGSGVIADAWRDRSAEKFLQALRTRLRPRPTP